MPNSKNTLPNTKVRYLFTRLKELYNKSANYINRGAAANLMMMSFILFTAIGCFQIYAPAGFISAGISCGIYGFLLGQE